MSLVGIIANPASGKDIRRLVAYGSVFDNQEKVRIVRRVLLGLATMGVERICYMPDCYGIVERALSEIELNADVFPLDVEIRGEQEDSTRTARAMQEQGADCIVVLGGDGTNRAVAKGNGAVPLLPISTGTNNVFPFMVEGTIAGLAAALIARELVPAEVCTFRSTKLLVLVDDVPADLALVDAAVYDDVFAGARAVWDMSKVRQIVLNRASPDSIGLSSIGGQVRCIGPDEPAGLYLELGEGGRLVVAAVAPGVIKRLYIKGERLLEEGEEVAVSLAPCILALDGEREFEVQPGLRTAIRLVREGPWVVDVGRTMRAGMERGILSPP
ncbi:MAG: NAD(+)/NADH kinase [bacterium]